MILMFINWLWIFVTFFVTGFGVCKVIRRKSGSDFWLQNDVILMCGLAVYAIFTQIYALFNNISYLAYGLQAVIVTVLLIYCRKDLILYAASILPFLKKYWPAVMISLLFFLYIDIGVSANYDDYLYHFQSERWIEEYGVVKGLANLHSRFGFISTFFFIQALYSWFPFMEQGIYGLNGFCAFYFFLYFVFSLLKKKEAGTPQGVYIVRMVSLLAVSYIISLIPSVAGLNTDILKNILILYIFEKIGETGYAGNENTEQYFFLSVLSVVAAGMNLSAFMSMLLAAVPFVLYLRRKEFLKAVRVFAVSLLAFLPVAARSIVSAGYVFFPLAQIDILNVKWKLDKSAVMDYNESVSIWGKNLQGLLAEKDWKEVASMLVTEWLPVWYRSSTRVCQIIFALCLVLIAVYIPVAACRIVKKRMGHTYVIFVLTACFAVWLLQAPSERFGLHYVWLIDIFIIAEIVTVMKKPVLYFMIIILCVYINTYIIEIDFSRMYYSLFVPEKIEYEMQYKTIQVENAEGSQSVSVYVPVQGDWQGYEPFPCTPYEGNVGNLVLLGDGLKDGFYTR